MRSPGIRGFCGAGSTIPIARSVKGQEEIDAVREVLIPGMPASGSFVEQFQREFARYCGTKHTGTMNSGTAALFSTPYALGIARKDEVIVPDFTFGATASSVRMAGAAPIFAHATNGPGFPVSDECARSVPGLPVHPPVADQDCRYICARPGEVA